MILQHLFQITLLAHIAAGSTALFTGLIALLSKKKKGRHTKTGFIFHIAMLAVVVSAIIMAILHHNYFLFVIGVFSFYLTYNGYRSIKFMKKQVLKPGFQDKAAIIISFILMIAVTIKFISEKGVNFNGFTPIILTFDVIFLLLLLQDVQLFKTSHKPTGNFWLIRHITRMVPAYISTLTAFLVVNVNYQYPIVIWLAPTVLLMPVIILNIKKYKRDSILKVVS